MKTFTKKHACEKEGEGGKNVFMYSSYAADMLRLMLVFYLNKVMKPKKSLESF